MRVPTFHGCPCCHRAVSTSGSPRCLLGRAVSASGSPSLPLVRCCWLRRMSSWSALRHVGLMLAELGLPHLGATGTWDWPGVAPSYWRAGRPCGRRVDCDWAWIETLGKFVAVELRPRRSPLLSGSRVGYHGLPLLSGHPQAPPARAALSELSCESFPSSPDCHPFACQATYHHLSPA